MIKKKSLTKSLQNVRLLTVFMGAAGFAAGIVNGFLGTGGGIVLMFALSRLPENSEIDARDKFATLIAVILPLSLISAIMYGDSIKPDAAVPYLIPGIIGGVCGAILLDKLNVKTVKRLFAAMVIWAGINFLR